MCVSMHCFLISYCKVHSDVSFMQIELIYSERLCSYMANDMLLYVNIFSDGFVCFSCLQWEESSK